MIIEMRTYTLQPGTVATFEERFAEALPVRAKVSPLAAFWHTEVGPLNRVIHVWPYENLEERTRLRAEATKLQGWPPNVREFVVEQQSEIYLPAPFSPALEPRQLGNRRAHQAVAVGRRLVLGAGRAQQMGAHLGLQGCGRPFPHPRGGSQQG